METYKKHSSKPNRVSAPFYSPSTRHYGQTPSEIIREARASVMTPPTPGIKPVLTSRPFTPKEKERTLFGNVKKRLSRPPSSFSLSYLQKPDSLPRIKLPAISSVLQKKTGRNPNFRSGHSLDNLMEEYEAEISEQNKHQDFRGLPFFRDSHSSPQERKMVRATSMTDSLSWKASEKRSIYTISQGYTEDVIPHPGDDLYFDAPESSRKCLLDFDGPRMNNFGEGVAVLQSTHFESKHEEARKKKNFDGNGDFVNNGEEERNIEKQNDEIEEKEIEIVENGINEIDELPEKYGGFQNTVKHRVSREDKKSEFQGSLGLKEFDSDSSENLILKLNTQSLSEKSIETEMVSDYLALMQKEATDVPKKGQIFKEKEILELYETAEYYGLLLNNSRESNSVSSLSVENTGKINNKTEENSKSDYLQAMKENIKNFDMKMKQLNESIETFEEKLNGRNRIYSSKKTDGRKTVSPEDVQFKMNDNKRYHIAVGAPNTKQRAHDKYLQEVRELTTAVTKKQESIGWDGFWKNSYYRQKGEVEPDVSTTATTVNRLEEILARLMKLDRSSLDNSDVIGIMEEIYGLLKNEDYAYKHVFDNENKIKILRSLYDFVDNENPEVLLNLSRIVFALRMDSSLLDACKMVFKVARSDANDYLFMELEDVLELFLDGIGLASPLDAAECCIYGYGALKFLTMNHRILSKLISLGVLDLLILHLKIINSAKLEGQVVNEQTQHALFQLTGAFRNIAAGDGVLPLFITTNSIPVLCKILVHFRQCEDLVTNISRTLSILSADEDATDMLMSVENILETILQLIEQYQSNDKILIRLAYCLGNIVAYSDLARIQLSRSEGSVAALLRILQLYSDKDLKLSIKENSKSENEGFDSEVVEDIIVKIVRIIANMCMNPVVGSNLSPDESNDKNALKLSEILTTILRRKDPGIVLLACLGCLNNISYYCSNHSSLIDITEGIVRVLVLQDEECQAEAARVLGNLTRNKEIRNLISSTGGIERLALLLDSKDKEVYRSACGALVNLMLDQESRQTFIESRGIDKLLAGLEKFTGDWSFAGLICRAIWNSCADDVESVMLHNNVEGLLNILASSLDEENWNDGDPAWEEFAFLATDLLEKINSHLENQTA